ncbi:MAG TPA: type II secretion system F family protein [Streptosporangiaceae bacterium]
MIASSGALLAIVVGAIAGAGIFLLIVAIRGLPPKPQGAGSGRVEAELRQLFGLRGAIALAAGLITLLVTGWVVAGIGAALLAFAWRGIGGAASERKAMARLEGLAMWTESLRDTIAGAVGLEQAIPASLRAASPAIHGPLERMVGRLHTRMPLQEALGRFADDIDDPSADLIIAALAINARLRGPGLRDLLSALAASVREELDMRRKVTADRSATRRSVQIVVGVSVGLVLVMGIFNRGYVAPYNSAVGQLVLVIVVVLYGVSFVWLRSLARFKSPERLLSLTPPVSPPAVVPETVTAWQGGAE